MRAIITKLTIVLFILAISFSAFSQKFGVGLSAIYNPQTESFAAGLRAEIPKEKYSIVPQVAYYPAFNKITEFYGGVSVHLNVLDLKKLTFYAIGNASYNGWLNYSSSSIEGGSMSNWGAEAGGGLTTKGCFRPFLEYRYNAKWQETNARFGLIYFFKCNNKNSKSRGNKGKRKAMSCPAYN